MSSTTAKKKLGLLGLVNDINAPFSFLSSCVFADYFVLQYCAIRTIWEKSGKGWKHLNVKITATTLAGL